MKPPRPGALAARKRAGEATGEAASLWGVLPNPLPTPLPSHVPPPTSTNTVRGDPGELGEDPPGPAWNRRERAVAAGGVLPPQWETTRVDHSCSWRRVAAREAARGVPEVRDFPLIAPLACFPGLISGREADRAREATAAATAKGADSAFDVPSP